MFSKLISSGMGKMGRGFLSRSSHEPMCRGSAFSAAVLEQPGAQHERNLKLRMFASNHTNHAKPAVLGIDLGTTNSCVAVMDGGRAVVVADERGRSSVPSLVHFAEDGRTLVGSEAKMADRSSPENTFGNSKRLIGRRFNEQAVLDLSAADPTAIVPAETGEAWMTDGQGRSFSPAEVSALVLTRLKRTAELYLGQEVGQAVVAVPASFNDSQRQATKQAALTAGLEVLRVINEPTAAALAYGLDELENGLEPKLTAVYDLGGGTFDVSLLQVENGVLQVRSSCGDPLLGGEDFDGVLTERILAKLGERQGVLTRCNRAIMRSVRDAAERAKRELSVEEETTIALPLLTDHNEPLSFELTRQEYEQMVSHLVQRTVLPCQRALAEAAVAPSDVGKVLLVGGMTRMPLVRETAAGIFEREPITGTELSPDEAVAAGAAVQGAILTGELSDMALTDVATMSLGIEVFAGTVQKLIVKNTALPAQFTQVVHNAAQPPDKMLEVNLYQGEEELAERSTLLARIKLPYVPSIEFGLTRTELTFRIDADGVVSVSASDADTGEPQRVDVDPYARGAVSQRELREFLGAAEEQRELSRHQIEHIRLVNSAELFVTDTERAIRLFLRQLPAEQAAGVLREITELREILDEIRERDDMLQYLTDFESGDRIRSKFEAAKQKSVALFDKAAQDRNKNKE